MKFDQYQKLIQELTKKTGAENNAGFDQLPDTLPERLPPLILAYIGDAYFSLYVRMRLLAYEQNKVRVLHTFGAKMVSAIMQARAVRNLEETLTETEAIILRRGRNAKSAVPKSASVSEYRYSTGFEAVIGYLFLKKEQDRLEYIASESFAFILKEINQENK